MAGPLAGLLFFFSLIFSFPVSSVQAQEVEGAVKFEGQRRAVTFTIEPKKGAHSTAGCGSLTKESQQLLVGDSGGLQNVLVSVDGNAPTSSGQRPLLDQKECVFAPHVLLVDRGQKVVIRNSDPVIHNVRIFKEEDPSGGMLMHSWQKADGEDLVWQFNEPGRFIVRCGVHPWMHAWVIVAPEGISTLTDGEGRFHLSGVSPGRHTLRIWHETLGGREIPIVVKSAVKKVEPILWIGKKEETSG